MTHPTDGRDDFENQYYQFEAKFNEPLRPVVEPSRYRHSSPTSSLSGNSNNTPRSHVVSHIKLPTFALPTFEVDTCCRLQYRDTFEALIVNNTTLSMFQKFYYIFTSLKNEAKDLISNIQITNDNFLVAWQLVTLRYNNKKLIAMMNAKQLCQLPQVRKGDAAMR